MTFTTTNVPKFAGVTSWEQYRQVFDAIILSNGWDDATAALQLLSHLEGDALNVAVLVPETRRSSLPSGTFSIIAGSGRVTQILTIGGLVGRDPRELYQSILWTTRVGERRPGRCGCYHIADSSGSVGDFAQTAASHPGGTATAFQTGTFRFGTVVTTATGGGGTQTLKPAPPVKTGITAIETLLQNLLPTSPGSSFADTAGPRASGLGHGGVFLVWQTKSSWRDPVSCTE